LVNLNGNLYGGSITTETLNSIGAEFNKMIQVSSIKVIDIAGNEITQTISNINSTIVDKTAPKMDWASLNLKISSIKKDNGNDMLLDADEYININLDIDDNGCYSSGIFYVRLFYNLNTDSSTGPQAAQSSSFQDWEYIEFIPLGNGSFYCVLSEEGKVGFNDGDEIDIIIMAMDFGNNNGTTEVLHMKFESEVDTTFSTSIMISMAIMVIGAITYRVKNRKIMKYISRGDEN